MNEMREKILNLALSIKEGMENKYKSNPHLLVNDYLYDSVKEIILNIDNFEHIMKIQSIGNYAVHEFDHEFPEESLLRKNSCKLDFWLERLRRNEVLKASKDIVN